MGFRLDPAAAQRGRAPLAALLASLFAASFAATLAAPSFAQTNAGSATRPNVLLIVADDLGRSDLGAFGSEIPTPNLDALVAQGRLLDTLYVAPTCSPTRSMLLSGIDNHLAGVGNMAEMITPHLTPEEVNHPGYEGGLNHRVAALPEVMKDGGYWTVMAGKWHLGASDGMRPDQRGFMRSYALMNGGAAHFRQKEMRITSDSPEPTYREDGKKIDLPEDFYSSRTYTDKLIEYLGDKSRDGRPFFAYAAYTAAHLPLQAPDDALRRFHGQYDVGYDVIAQRRIDKMKRLGLVPADTKPAPLPEGTKAWNALSDQEKARSARTMQAYAAMVSELDRNVGRLIDYLKASGQYDNTLIVFLSDNGPEGNEWDKDSGNAQWIAHDFNNTLDNIGRPDSFVFEGPAWGQVSAQPFRLFKAYTNEGGIRSPSFISYPGHIQPGKAEQMLTVKDFTPTILDFAGIRQPGIEFHGQTVLPMQGMSMKPWLTGERKRVHVADYVYGMELMGRKALRKGNWKLVYSYDNGKGHWQLYDLAHDRGELHDLSAKRPEVVEELLTEWSQYVQQNNVVETGRDTSYPRADY
ncbi:arylsulfatase [Paraburkholderia sp. Ac-20340]|uniref:arylsulfatase n=1 Tax=Paraburkholderia sp. Ac-20340 TaxID=2703888 RepID=UPI00197F545B|nr:arylsulfatase [Paraburkholderia sp. Ac-20340]